MPLHVEYYCALRKRDVVFWMQATFFGPAIADAGAHSVRLSQDIALGSGVHSTDPEIRTAAEAAAAAETSVGGEGAASRISFWTRAKNTLEVFPQQQTPS